MKITVDQWTFAKIREIFQDQCPFCSCPFSKLCAYWYEHVDMVHCARAFLKRETKLWAKWLRKPRYGSWLFQQTHMWRCHSGKWRWKAWEKWDSKTQMIDGMPLLLGAICWRVQGNKWTQYNFEIACYFYEINQCNRTYKVQVYLPSPDSSPFLCL